LTGFKVRYQKTQFPFTARKFLMTIQASTPPSDAGSALRDRLDQLQIRVGGRLKLGFRANFIRYGLCRDLAEPIKITSAKIPIAVRPLQNADFFWLFSSEGSRDPAEKLQVAWRKAFIQKGAPGGFVAVDQRNGRPCYVQWLLGSANNDFVRRIGGFPVLQPKEALLEFAYTPPGYRGLGIMSAAMALIAQHAADIGARQVLTFVDHDNIASLRGCQRAGFRPQQIHHRTRFGFGLITLDRFSPMNATATSC
jgi:RimJ/RimL family protein N-acetyltransferase